jgi:hypothetical protein
VEAAGTSLDLDDDLEAALRLEALAHLSASVPFSVDLR